MTTATPLPYRRRRHHGSTVPSSLLLLLLLSLLCSTEAQYYTGASSRDLANPRSGFSPAMAIIVVILFSAFFIMVFFSIYLRNCGERGDASAGAAGRALPQARSRLAARGLDAAVIQAFPTLVYAEVKEHKIGKGALECAVCLCEFEDEETLRLLPKCDHVFHTGCIDAWLSSHTTCPVCRANLSPDEPNSAAVAAAAAETGEDAAASDVAAGEDTQGEGVQAPGQQQDHVAIVIDEPEAGERMTRAESKRRLRRWWSRSLGRPPPPRLPRSHTTGHSMAVLVRPGEDCERYTLRLPEHIRRDVMAGKLRRTPSTAAFARKGSQRAAGEGSSSGGGGRSFKLRRWEWAAKSDRWAFFSRTFSIRTPRGDNGGAGEGSTKSGEGSVRKGVESGGAVPSGEGSVKGKVFPL